MRTSILRHFACAPLVALALLLTPAVAHAQSAEPVVPQEALTKQPKLSSPSNAAAMIARAYPSTLRRAGVGGVVQLELTIDKSGRVEKNSVEVVVSSAPALGEAAKTVAERLDFKPGEVDGAPVRSRVLLPVSFVAN